MLEPVTGSQIPVEQKIFNDAWKLLKNYHDINQNGTDEDWDRAIALASSIYESGTGRRSTEKLSKALALGVLDYLEALGKE